MAKTKITDYSATRASNADIDGINIAEGCPAGNLNDAVRELMVQLAEANAGTAPVADTWTFADPADPTKRVRLDAGNVTAGQTRVLTVPDQNVTITAAGAAILDDADAAAQRVTIGGANPAGEVAFFAMNNAPTGWLKANGATISRTTYAALFAAIGTTFGAGDGSTTFHIPDLRAEFIRGWDDGRGTDSGRAFGSWQGEMVGNHTHGLSTDLTRGGTAGSAWAYSSGIENRAYGPSATQGIVGTATETRPRNVALLACIKF